MSNDNNNSITENNMWYIDKTDPRSPDYEEPMTEEEIEAIEQAQIDREIERRYYEEE